MERPVGNTPETTPSWSEVSRRRTSFYLIAAVILAILAGYLSYNYLETIRQQSLPSSRVLVARVNIEPGTGIDESMVELRAVPKVMQPSTAIRTIAEVIGRESILPIQANEVLLHNRLVGIGSSHLSARLPEGRWAMVLPGSWLASPLPELSAGDRVDLLALHQSAGVDSGGLLVQGIQILTVSGSSTSPDAITLSVSMSEAESILIARANGFLILALLRPTGG
jgi:Flp pilus assembly protein CpaB